MSFIRRSLDRILFSKRAFDLFQRIGVHVTPNHFYSPVPDTRELDRRAGLWDKESDMPGVDLRPAAQLEWLRRVVSPLRHECSFPLDPTGVPHEYFVRNGAFGLISAAVLHCMVRHFSPRTLIEIGSGNSTYVSARAVLMNQAEGKPGRLLAVEPHPGEVLRRGFPGLTRLIPEKVQDLGRDLFTGLQAGDILFIDSSHVVRMENDVLFLYLDVLPRLAKGVVVHIHDIFLPRHYPRRWVVEGRRFWTEQYLLQAFLTWNPCFEVLWSGCLMQLRHPEVLRSVFPLPEGLSAEEGYASSSFWMRRVG
ncbi:MAG TPA: class I SAM-dependent methyltransferase [Candidatus Polarisedimenticolia bacterium]|jgi:hypothetical protein|nr:class I SAM-dependent methyltransferase [Candidatus Polarisedimenticolia bacterium]